MYIPESNLHMVLQQDQQICGHFDIFCVAHLRLQTHHNEDKKRYPSCDEKFYFSNILDFKYQYQYIGKYKYQKYIIMNNQTYFYSRQLS